MDESKKRKTYIGQVVSDKMDKTVVLGGNEAYRAREVQQNHQTYD